MGVDDKTGLTFDGWQLDVVTGEPLKRHNFTAASKESLHLALLGHVLNENPRAKVFYSVDEALNMLTKKINTYEKFNSQYPGFGGFLPWIFIYDNGTVTPTWDF